jgi:hypothetical protein
MFEEINKIESPIFKTFGSRIVNVTEDKECPNYYGCTFQLGSQQIKFRKAKSTPKKIGQFVTLWKRGPNGRTVPYDLDDDFDFYIILSEYGHQCGFFVFPKEILARMGILTSDVRKGKRGFRLYPEWNVPVNNQSLRTKKWQKEYFIEIDNEEKTIEKLQKMFTPIFSHI